MADHATALPHIDEVRLRKQRATNAGINKVAFFITLDQLAALKSLEGSAARSFKAATWLALVKKRLVTLTPEPALTPAGLAFLSFNRVLGPVNAISEGEEPTPLGSRGR
ncbi:hypothetical protein AYO46_07430 [Betaproteobacteria bacterium SCGC AG-212-J23]|nr:hypothetical protein AYO46_07430 [Betaproteobacteria bacterium SCGC AG-212-J23]